MAGTTIRSTTAAGGRKPSEETRAKLQDAGRRSWAALTPEQQEARRAQRPAAAGHAAGDRSRTAGHAAGAGGPPVPSR